MAEFGKIPYLNEMVAAKPLLSHELVSPTPSLIFTIDEFNRNYKDRFSIEKHNNITIKKTLFKIYKITYLADGEKCSRYIQINPRENYFILTIIDNKIIVINLNNINGVELDAFISKINAKLKIEGILNLIINRRNDNDPYNLKKFYLECKIYVDKDGLLFTKKCSPILNIEGELMTKIQELNNILNENKCTNYKIEITYPYLMNNDALLCNYNDNIDILTLCFMDGKDCISSIEISYVNNELIISSFTCDEYTKKGYNTILRAATIYLAKDIIKYIFHSDNENILISSFIANSLSLYILLKYFDAKIYAGWDTSFDEELDIETNTPEEIDILFEQYQDDDIDLIAVIKPTDENIQRALRVFSDKVSKLCKPKEPSVPLPLFTAGRRTKRRKTRSKKRRRNSRSRSRNPKLTHNVAHRLSRRRTTTKRLLHY